MNDTDVSKQIQQMVRFIRQEAEEKANEISVSAEEVYISFSPSFFFGFWNWILVKFDCFWLGIQYREVAIGGGREEEDQARVRAQREASRCSKEDVQISFSLSSKRIGSLKIFSEIYVCFANLQWVLDAA